MAEAKPQADPLIGRTFEKVRLVEKLGAGGMGTVYLAEHATLGKRVAVKVLPEHLSRDPEYVSRFLREAETAAKLEHPNIVQVHDIGFADGKYFIVMQYVQGESLQKIIESMGPLDPRDAAEVIVGVLRGLHYAHGRGIVHRDIKPDNILITKGNQPRILDFGLAIETDSTMKLTAEGTVVGTPWFISPEQARGHQAEPRSDVYSAGVTLYYLLAGRVPFQAQGALAVLNKHIHDTPVPPMTLNPRVPPVLDAVVMKMLAKKPEDRYVSAETAARDLEAFLEHRPISMAKASSMAIERVPPAGAKKDPLVWVAGGVAAGLIAILVIVAMRTAPPAPPVRPPPPVQPPVVIDDGSRAEIEAARREAAKVDEELRAHEADYGAYPMIRDQYGKLRTKYANNPGALAIVTEALHRFSEKVEAKAKPLAEEAMAQAQALVSTDPYAALEAYGGFPKPLLDLCPSGRTVAEARAKLDAKLQAEFPAQIDAVEGMIRKEDYDGARSRAEYLMNRVQSAHHAKLRELCARADLLEAENRDKLAPGLQLDAAQQQSGLRDPLSRGRTAAALAQLADYLESKPRGPFAARLMRVKDVDYAALSSLRVEEAIEGDLERLIGVLERAQSGDAPSFRLLLLFEDVLRREWLQRRVEKGTARLTGATVALETIQARGKLTPGALTPEGSGPKPFSPRELVPADLVFLAAAADYGAADPATEAFKANGRLCAAAGIAYLHSRSRDRFHAARRWLGRARELDAPVPRFRLDELDLEVQIEFERLTRELFSGAHALADQKKFDEAQRALDDLLAKYRDRDLVRTLEPIVEHHRVRFLLAEARAARDAKNWSRVRDLVKQARRKAEEGPDREAAEGLHREAILNLGLWQPAPIPSTDLAKSRFWLWEGRNEGTAPPAKLFDGGLRLTRNLPIFCSPDFTDGCTGVSAKFRLNEQRTLYHAGLRFDVTGAGGEKWLRVLSTGELAYYTIEDRKLELAQRGELPAKIEVGAWHEIAFVADGGELVFYYDRQPLFAVKGALGARNLFGLEAEGDVTFKDIRIRDMKPR